MKENKMKPRRLPRHNGTGLQGKTSNIPPLAQTNTPQTAGAKPFTGKVFYLDLASNRLSETLESDIKELGGTVEKFFSKEIKYLVSSKREAKYVQCLRQDSPVPSPESGPSSPQPLSTPHQPLSQRDSTKSVAHIQKDTFAASRGKSLVKRVVKEQERIQMNKILSNALDWGVKILYLDDVLAYVQKKKKVACSNPHPATNVKTNIKIESSTKHGFQKCKGGRISKPFIKVEDSSRHYRPFYLSLSSAPEFSLKTRPPCTPFCVDDAQGQRGARASATDVKANDRKKNKKQGGFCECCQVKYDSLSTHLQGDRHKTFARSNKYLVVDKLVSTMHCNFIHIQSNIKRPKYSVSSSLIAPGPFVKTKSRLKRSIKSAVVIEEKPLSPCTIEEREEDHVKHVSNISSVPVVHRTTKRRKHCTFSDISKHKPKQPCRTATEEETDIPQMMGSKDESDAACPAFTNEVQHNSTEHLGPRDNNRPGDLDMNVETEPKPKQESSPSGPANCGNMLQEKMTDNCVFERVDSSDDFIPVTRIQRKVKVYKRKRRKLPTPVVSSELVEPSDAADNGRMRLWELFQDSDDMDIEFYGFRD